MLDVTNDVLEPSNEIERFNPDGWTLRVDYRKRDRMKINFKLSKEESEAYSNFKNQTKPDQISEDQFLKSIFFLGITTLEANISKKIQNELEKMDEDVSLEVPEEDGPEESVEVSAENE